MRARTWRAPIAPPGTLSGSSTEGESTKMESASISGNNYRATPLIVWKTQNAVFCVDNQRWDVLKALIADTTAA